MTSDNAAGLGVVDQVGRQLRQLLLRFHEDWTHEFADPYELAEAAILGLRQEALTGLGAEVAEFVGADPCLESLFPDCQMGARLDGQAEFEAWLSAVQRRIEQRLVGDDSEPLVAPV